MTVQELGQKINDARRREEKALKDIASFARNLVPVLEDAHAAASAKELSRLLFVLDVEQSDLQNWVTENAGEVFSAMIESAIMRLTDLSSR